MNTIVQKFGGTSVASEVARSRIASIVAKAKGEGYTVVLVVSAMGRSGDPYATDTLIRLARSAYLETSAQDMDLLTSCGEIISAVVLCSTLKAHGIDSLPFSGGAAGILTDDTFGNAQILAVDPSPLVEALAGGKVAVVAGFQGVTKDGRVTTLGRGGSDTTAAALGAALNASVVEIYTDVDGIKTADPRVVPDAQTIEQMTYEEICEMAHQGAKVIHPRAVEIAMKTGVPLRIRSTFDDAPGTLVTQKAEPGFLSEARPLRPVTGITNISGLCRIEVRNLDKNVYMSSAFRALANAKISVDMIFVTPTLSSFVIKEDALNDAESVLRRLHLEPLITRGCAKVSAVGVGMRGMPGVMANVSEALHEAGVEILQTADSHTTISCLIKSEDLERAARALHSRFGLETSERNRRE